MGPRPRRLQPQDIVAIVCIALLLGVAAAVLVWWAR
jgi:uncharacterized iron-regulated membrane protein